MKRKRNFIQLLTDLILRRVGPYQYGHRGNPKVKALVEARIAARNKARKERKYCPGPGCPSCQAEATAL